MRTRLAAVMGGVTLVLTLTACGGDEQTSATGSGGAPAPIPVSQISSEHNQADVRFVQHMIPHHQQAIEMTQLAAERAGREEVKALAEQISAAQGPEIETMQNMLERWGVAMDGMDGMGDMDHSHMGHSQMGGMDHSHMGDMGDMQGMMTPQQMNQLTNASGAEFDRLFLEMMVAHHQGAVEMARAVQANGQNQQAIELARQIEQVQLQEIQHMQDLLAN